MTTAGLPALLGAVSIAFAAPAQAPVADPAQQEVALPCATGWRASLVFDARVGVWTVACANLLPQYGCPEVIALDDRGRCTVLRSYSGRWTPQPTIEDGKWFAPVAVGDLDPGLPGVEIYTGGLGGRLWQIRPRPAGHFDCRVVDEWPGEEIHTLVLGEFDAQRRGAALLAFLASGRVHVVRPPMAGGHGLEVGPVAQLSGRVRQAVALGLPDGPALATVSRAGELAIARLRGTQLEQRIVAREPMGLGRLVARIAPDNTLVVYATRDDGVVLRYAGPAGGELAREIVYVGPQGPRGIAAGRLHEDPRRECLAVFGYSQRVELLSRLPGEPWQSEVIFTDVDKGHWLDTAELDGRNATDELIGSGYSGRVFLLSRPPGYGLREAGAARSTAIEPDAAKPAAGPIRVGLRARGAARRR
jgi:hypothetical protein